MLIPAFSRVQSLIKTLDVEATVSDLIEEEVGRWKENMVDEVFSVEEIVAIQSIPLSCLNKRTG